MRKTNAEYQKAYRERKKNEMDKIVEENKVLVEENKAITKPIVVDEKEKIEETIDKPKINYNYIYGGFITFFIVGVAGIIYITKPKNNSVDESVVVGKDDEKVEIKDNTDEFSHFLN